MCRGLMKRKNIDGNKENYVAIWGKIPGIAPILLSFWLNSNENLIGVSCTKNPHEKGSGCYQLQLILFTRVWCRPPSNGVSIKTSIICFANSNATNRAGMQITLASLCWRIRRATSFCQLRPALIPWCLLAVIHTPFALPQSKIPNAASSFSTASATGCA